MKKQYFYLILTVFILSIPALLLSVIGLDSIVSSLSKKIVFYLFSISILIIPLLFVKPKYYGILGLLLTPIFIFEIFNIQKFKGASSEEANASLFYTNGYEGLELMNSNLIYILIFVFVFISFLILTIKLKKSFKLTYKIKLFIFFYIFSIISIIYVRDFYIINKIDTKATLIDKIEDSLKLLKIKVNKSYPLGNLFKLYEAKKGINSIKNYQNKIKDFKFNTIKRDSLKEAEIYILVIGETARKSSFNFYGYHRNTNPNLLKIKNLLVFNDVKSSANVTSMSLPFMVTRATPQHIFPKLNEPALSKAFEEVGFKTYWLTNQAAGLDNVFAFYSRLSNYYKNIAISIDIAKYDGDLLPELDIVLSDTTTNKKFIIIHTLGSHYNYAYRYPKKFKVFKPTIPRKMSLTGNSIKLKQETINSYDNSILYTDFVLSKIIDKVKQTNSVASVYYISDHGENLYDDKDELLMHGYLNPKKEVIDIPLFIWNSDSFNNLYPNKFLNLKKHQNSKISTINTFETLLDLANIQIKDSVLTKSFANDNFKEKPRFLLSPNKKIISLD